MSFRRNISIAVISILGASAAQADVIYDWQPVAGTDLFSTVDGQFVVSDSAYRSGDLSYQIRATSLPPEPDDPDSPIIETSLDIDFPQSMPIVAYPRQGADVNPTVYDLDADVSFVGESLLGSLSLVNTFDEFAMTSDDDGLWTINRFGTDASFGGPCGDADGCGGATGRWVLDSSSVPSNEVPEPSSWLLFGLGLVALLGIKRKQTRV